METEIVPSLCGFAVTHRAHGLDFGHASEDPFDVPSLAPLESFFKILTIHNCFPKFPAEVPDGQIIMSHQDCHSFLSVHGCKLSQGSTFTRFTIAAVMRIVRADLVQFF